MKVREAKAGIDWDLSESGKEMFHCPVCKTLWLGEDEPVESYCKHLRFILFTSKNLSEFIAFSGSWDNETLEQEFWEAVEDGSLPCAVDIDQAVHKVLTAIQHPAIDTVVSFKAIDGKGSGSTIYFGFKEDCPSK